MRSYRWLIVTVVAAAVLFSATVPSVAQAGRRGARMGRGGASGRGPGVPMPMLMGRERDPELTALVRDIVVLRAVNSIGMTKEQIQKLVPILEDVVAAEQRLREQALRELRAERARLVAGTGTQSESRDALAAISEARRQYARELEQAMSKASALFAPEQLDKIKKLTAGMGQAGGAPPGPGQGRQAVRGAVEAGPSSQALEHLVSLLKEKLQAMQ